jgi:hypothetical protein
MEGTAGTIEVKYYNIPGYRAAPLEGLLDRPSSFFGMSSHKVTGKLRLNENSIIKDSISCIRFDQRLILFSSMQMFAVSSWNEKCILYQVDLVSKTVSILGEIEDKEGNPMLSVSFRKDK